MPANNVTPSKSPETDEEFRAGEGTRTRLCKRDVMCGLAGLQGRERVTSQYLAQYLGVRLTRWGLLTKEEQV